MPEPLSGLIQPAPLPLSTRYTAPWMATASSLARKAMTAATSCGCIMPRGAAAGRQEPRLVRPGRRTARSTVESATDRPSPARQISRDPLMWLCHESIYQAVCQPHSRLIRPPQVRSLDPGPLRMDRTHRHACGGPFRCPRDRSEHVGRQVAHGCRDREA